MSVEIPEIEPPKPRKFIKQPDVDQKNKQINKLNDEIKKIEASVNLISTQIESTTTSKADSEKRQALTSELRKIISTQDDIKKKRQNINDQVRLIDQGIKKKVAEINSKTSKYSFKTVDDIDKRIRKLEGEIEAGNLMLVEEKKSLKEITSLNKLKKDFTGIEQTQKSIDSDKAKIAELKATLSSVSNKEIQTKFEEITKELDELTTKNKSVQTKRDDLFNKRRTLQNEKYELLKQIRKIRDDFDAKFKKFKQDMDNERKKREEEEKAYTLFLQKKDLVAEIKQIEESSKVPAFAGDIANIKSAITSLDPSVKFEEETNLLNIFPSSTLDKSNVKISEVSLPEDAEIIKKEEEAFVTGTAKSKKTKKNNKKKQFKGFDSTVMTQLAVIGVNAPKDQEEVPKIVEQLKEKLEDLKKEQTEAGKKLEEEANEKISKIKEQISTLDKEILEELAKEKERVAKPVDSEEKKTAEESES